MATYKKRPDFFSSEEGIMAFQVLKEMVGDNAYHTESSYSANASLYPDHSMPFVDKHMLYLRDHPSIDTRQYISNLRLMTKLK